MQDKIKQIARNILNQDNRMTSNPIFVVQQKRIIYGLDDGDEAIWVDDDFDEVLGEERIELETRYGNGDIGERHGDYTRVYVQVFWDHVTSCFTEQGAKDYIAANGYNLKEPRIYVETGYRNEEWQIIREFLKKQV